MDLRDGSAGELLGLDGMKSNNFGAFHLRKWYSHHEETLTTETGVPADGEPRHRWVIAALVTNPFAGEHGPDLGPIVDNSAVLGQEVGRRIKELSDGHRIQSYGKACLVGVGGEYDHGNAFLTTVSANPVRDALGGAASWIPSTGKRGGPGTQLDIPLAHKDALYVRSHYDTITVMFDDGPAPDEIVLAFAFASRGRLNSRLGGLSAAEIEGNGLT
jgi:hypothetical protein